MQNEKVSSRGHIALHAWKFWGHLPEAEEQLANMPAFRRETSKTCHEAARGDDVVAVVPVQRAPVERRRRADHGRREVEQRPDHPRGHARERGVLAREAVDDRARRVQDHALGREQLLERAWMEDVGGGEMEKEEEERRCCVSNRARKEENAALADQRSAIAREA